MEIEANPIPFEVLDPEAGKALEWYVQMVNLQALNPSADCGRNDPCPCNSGIKYKKCCGRI